MRHVLAALALLLMTLTSVKAQEAVMKLGASTSLDTLTILSTTDIAIFAPVLSRFLQDNPRIAVDYQQWGSNDLAALAGKICAGQGTADLIISSAIDLQVELVNQNCAATHQSPMTANLPLDLNWRDQIFGITREPAVMIYNKDLVSESEAPRSRFDLIDLLRPADSRFAGKVATYDIEASGLGYLFAFVDSQQANTFGRLLEAFGRTKAVATCCSAEIIDAVAEGKYLIAYNVLGSYALARAETDPRIGVRAPTDYTLMLSRAAYIPKQTDHKQLAGNLIDFLLSPNGQDALAKSRLIVSVGESEESGTDLPGGGPSSLRPIQLSPVLLAGLDDNKRRIFLDQWRLNLNRQ